MKASEIDRGARPAPPEVVNDLSMSSERPGGGANETGGEAWGDIVRDDADPGGQREPPERDLPGRPGSGGEDEQSSGDLGGDEPTPSW